MQILERTKFTLCKVGLTKLILLVLLLTIPSIIYVYTTNLKSTTPNNLNNDSVSPTDDYTETSEDVTDNSTHKYYLTERINDTFLQRRKEELKSDILDILAEDKDDYGVYIKSLDFDFELAINKDEHFYPASTIKVPIAILVLRDIESGLYTLDTKLQLREDHKHYTSDVMYYYPTGSYYSIETLLYNMIHYSDNSAWDMLTDNMGTTAEVDARIKEELQLENTHRINFETTATDMCYVLENLYNYSYLTKDNSAYLLELLSDIVISQNDRIPQGVPEGTRVAHKIGSWKDTYQDVGIVYGEDFVYILVILNRNTTVSKARSQIISISEKTWDFFDN